MKDMHYSIVPGRSAKQQALDVIRLLKEKIPIARAQMKVALVMSSKDGKRIQDKLKTMVAKVEKEEVDGNQYIMVFSFFIVMDTHSNI
jgi:ribosome maturation protein SDO1